MPQVLKEHLSTELEILALLKLKNIIRKNKTKSVLFLKKSIFSILGSNWKVLMFKDENKIPQKIKENELIAKISNPYGIKVTSKLSLNNLNYLFHCNGIDNKI